MKMLKKIIVAIVIVSSFVLVAKAQVGEKPFTLERNKNVEREIAADQIQSYEIKAGKEEFLHVVIDQKSVDTVARLFASDGKKLLEIDNPNIKRGPEQIFFIAPATDVYKLEIKAKEPGRYEIGVELLRKATPPDQKRIDAERAFIEAANFSAASAPAQALPKYEEALQIINGLNDSYGEATILFNLGRTHKYLGDTQKSAEFFAKSLTLFQTAGSWDEIFKNLSPLYLFMGGKQQTFDYLAGALPLVRALKNQRLEAILLEALAKVCRDLNRSDAASDYDRQALELFRITGKRGAEIFTLTEISDADLTLEDKKKAIDYLNQALLLSQSASDKSLEASLLTGIGYIYASIDEPQKALDYFQKTLPVWRELKDKNGEAYSLNFIGSIYSQLGDYSLARDYLEQSLLIIKQTNDLRAQAYTTTYLGAVENRSGDSSKAFEYYQKALKVFQETGEKTGEAQTLSNLAEINLTNGDKQKALENYEKALTIWRGINFRDGETNALSTSGFVYDYIGETEKALSNHNQALPIFRLLGNQSGEAISLYGAARIMYKRGNLDEALVKAEAAINIIESIRTKITGTDLRATYLANYQHLYQFYVDLLMQINKTKPSNGFDARALQASERARARGLLDILNEAQANIRQGIAPALLERELDLQKQLYVKDTERKRARNPQKAETIDKEIRKLTADFQQLEVEIKQKSPRYAALTQPQPAGLKEIQQQLDKDTLLLEYSLGETNSYLWVVSSDSLKTFTLPKREIIENQARLFYEAVKVADGEQKVKQSVADLSKILIEPAAAELKDKRLLIVADGALNYLPFAALENPKSKIRNPKSDEPLIVNHEIVYIPSASALAALRSETNGRATAPKTVAVIADPVFDANDTRINPNGNQNTSSLNSTLKTAKRDAGFDNLLPLPRLPGTRREATNILALVADTEKKRATDFEASRATVTGSEMAQFRIIHFATHGLLNSQHPELSGIVFSLVDEKGNPQDGFLRLQEIYNLKLPADLIVLSACRTALGKEIKGEGLIGLTRGFMYAGAQRVVASLWAVDDRATSELMKNFYQAMLGEKKLRPAAALREAQIIMLNDKRFNSPYYWSAFTVQGEWK